MPAQMVPIVDRIRRLSQPDASSGCWVWKGRPQNRGYGQIAVRPHSGAKPQTLLAHRVSYEAFVGPIPAGLVIDHLCGNPPCVNPAHLEPVTQRENTMRSGITLGAINAAKTHCSRGHEFTPENTAIYILPNGTTRERACRQCRAIRNRRSYERRLARKAVAA